MMTNCVLHSSQNIWYVHIWVLPKYQVSTSVIGKHFFAKEVTFMYLDGLQSIHFCHFLQFFKFDHIWICYNESIQIFSLNLNCINFKLSQYFECFVIHFATSIPNVPTAKKLMKKNQTYCII